MVCKWSADNARGTPTRSSTNWKMHGLKNTGLSRPLRQTTASDPEQSAEDKQPKDQQWTMPSYNRRACEHSPDRIRIQQLRREAAERGQDLVYGGMDCGLCTMSTTIAMTEKQYNARIAFYNRYSPLADAEHECDDNSNIPVDDSAVDTPPLPPMPKPIRITAEELEQQTLSRAHARKRERRKARCPDVQQAEDLLAANPLEMVQSLERLVECHEARRNTRDVLRSFYRSKRAHREKRTQKLRTTQTYDRIAAEERRRVPCVSDSHCTYPCNWNTGHSRWRNCQRTCSSRWKANAPTPQKVHYGYGDKQVSVIPDLRQLLWLSCPAYGPQAHQWCLVLPFFDFSQLRMTETGYIRNAGHPQCRS